MAIAPNIEFTVLLLLSAFCFASIKGKKCVEITIPLCQNIGYNLTSMPNMFNHSTQEEAALEIHQFWPLVEINCSPDLNSFLCYMFAPMCSLNSKEEVPPCRSICESARNGCEPLLLQYGFSWPERMKCDKFPGRNKSCLSGSSTQATQSSTTVLPSVTSITTKVSAAQENRHVNCCSSTSSSFVSVFDKKTLEKDFKPSLLDRPKTTGGVPGCVMALPLKALSMVMLCFTLKDAIVRM